MAEEKRTIVVFMDAPCIDGAGSGWCFLKKFGADQNVNLELVPLGHGNPEYRKKIIQENISQGADVFFVDTSPKEKELEELLSPAENSDGEEKRSRVKSVTVWDHHKSEKDRLNGYKPPAIKGYTPPALEIEINTDMPSAAVMVWKKLFGEEKPPEIFNWIGKMEPPVTLKSNRDFAIAAAIDKEPIKTRSEIATTFNNLAVMTEEDLVHAGNAILADQMNNTEKMTETVMYAQIQLLPGLPKMWVPVVNANVQYFGRRVNQALIRQGAQGTTVGVSGAWFQQGDGSVKLSIRTNGHPDASEIAKFLSKQGGVGGGGHATDAVVQYKNLKQFSDNVPLYTKEEMHTQQWQPAEPATE